MKNWYMMYNIDLITI